MDRKAWCAAVHRVAKNQTQPNDWTELAWDPGCALAVTSYAVLAWSSLWRFPGISVHTTLSLPFTMCVSSRIFSFLSNSKVDVTTEVPLEMPQIRLNQVPFTPQNCKLVFTRMPIEQGKCCVRSAGHWSGCSGGWPGSVVLTKLSGGHGLDPSEPLEHLLSSQLLLRSLPHRT